MSSQFDHHHHAQHHSHYHHNRAATFLGREQMASLQDHPLVRIFVHDNYRYIIANGLPNHAIGAFPNAIKPQIYELEQNKNWECIMTAEKKSLPVDLDDVEKEKLRQIATKWGVSLSAAIKKLIREAPL